MVILSLAMMTLVACNPPAPKPGIPNNTSSPNAINTDPSPSNVIVPNGDPIAGPGPVKPVANPSEVDPVEEPIVRDPVDLGARDILTQLKPIARAGAVAYSEDGNLFASAPDDVLIFEMATRRVIKRIHVGDYPVIALDFSDDGKMLAAGMWSFEGDENEFRAFHIHVFELPSGKELAKIEAGHANHNTRRRVRISPDNKKIADSTADGISVYEIETGEVTWEFVKDKTLNPNGSYAAFDVTPDWKYFLFDLQRISYPEKETLKAIKFNDKEAPFFWDNLISADGRFAVAIGGANGTEQKIFNLEERTLETLVEGVPSRGFAATRDFKKIVNAHGYWNTSDGSIVKAASRPNSYNEWFAATPDGREGTINYEYVNLSEKRGPRTIWGQNPYFGSAGAVARFNRDGQLVVSAGGAGRVVNLKEGKLGSEESVRDSKRREYRTKFGRFPVATSPSRKLKMDSKGYISKGDAKTYIFESLAAGKNPSRGQPHFVSDKIALFISPKMLHLFDIDAKKMLHQIPVKMATSEVSELIESADGKLVLISAGAFDISHRRYVCVLNVETGELALPVELKAPCRVRMTKDGKYIISFGDKWVEVQSVTDQKVAHRFQLETGNEKELVIQDGGTMIAVATDNNCVETFDFVAGERSKTIVVRGTNRTKNIALLDEKFEILEVKGERDLIFE
jgi:WD40 repeat protein